MAGFGLSEWSADGYWFADYIADLDALLDHFTPGEPVRLVGHSLGGNIVMLYAGIRPQRLARVVSLEGFGIPTESPDIAPDKFARWLDALKDPRASALSQSPRLPTNAEYNPRLSRDKA